MRARSTFVAGIAALLVLAAAAPARAEGRAHTMTLEECVASALARNAEARSNNLDVTAAKEEESGVKGELLPKLRAEGLVQEWDRPFNIAFGPQNFRVREAFNWNATVTIQQPLTGLFEIFARYKVQSIGVEIADLHRKAAHRDLVYRVAETYLRLLESERLAEVAKTSISQLEAQRKQAMSLLENGVIGKNDELRAELALANAKQREIQLRGQVVVARATLAAMVGYPEDTTLEPMPIAAGDSQANEEVSAEAATSKAFSQRFELRELDERIAQQDARVSAAQDRHIPNVSAIGSYLHVEGSAFQLKDSAFVGAAASWDVWDWGTTSSNVRGAETRREQAKLARAMAGAAIRIEVSKAFTELESAKEALLVARTARDQAEENYRIVAKRFEQAAATSFDVVDAESLLTTARAQVENAFYGYLSARLALQRATGGTTPRLR